MTKLDVIYCRVSTDEQAGDYKTSIPEQESKSRLYLSQVGYNNIRVFREDYSGFEFERPELDKIRDLIKQNKVRSLTFLRVDRLSRQTGHLDQLREGYFRPYGVEVYTVEVLGKWEWTPSHIYLQNQLVSFSQFWGSIIVQIMRDGKIGRVKAGNTMAHTHAPLGYTEIKTETEAHFEINKLEADIVKLIFRFYVDGGINLAQITKRLNDESIPTYDQLRNNNWTRSSGQSKWYSTTVRNVLKNPAYKGEWLYNRTKSVKSYDENGAVTYRKRKNNQDTIIVPVPPIVDEETWGKAQERLAKNLRHERGRRTKYDILLARRMRCACGLKMGHMTKQKGRYKYYRCPGSSGENYKEDCPGLTFRTEQIDTIAFNWLANIVFDHHEFQRRLDNYVEEKKKAVEPLEERLRLLDKLIKRDEGKLEKLIDLYLDSDTLTKEMLEGKKKALEESIFQNSVEQESLMHRISEMTAEFDWEMSTGHLVKAVTMDFNEDRNELEENFDKRLKFIQKYDLRGELVWKDGRYMLRVSSRLGQSLLNLYNTHQPGIYATRARSSPAPSNEH